MNHQLKQLIPSEICLACEVCCRFPDRQSPMAPVFSAHERGKAIELGLSRHDFPPEEEKRGFRIRPKPLGDCFHCPAFEPMTHECQIYPDRPFDCQLYPFLLMFDAEKKKISLVMDLLCPFIQTHKRSSSVEEYSRYLLEYLSRQEIINWLCQNQNLIAEFKESVIPISDLDKLTHTLIPCLIQRGFHSFSLEDSARFKSAFEKRKPILSCENFVSHYLWSELLHYYWIEIRDQLCLFAEQDHHLFMPIPPMGDGLDSKLIQECFEIMDFWNKNRSVSRIAGLKKEDLEVLSFPRSAWECRPPTLVEHDYLYKRLDLVELKGNHYKVKRANYNQFLRNYPNAIYRPFTQGDIPQCLRLYHDWLTQYRTRPGVTEPEIKMAEENYRVHQKAMLEYEQLGLTGRVIEVAGKIAAYTFGTELNPETFYIFFEITDVTLTGISQYLFRLFCQEMKGYLYLHAGGDSGFESLRKVKISYRPIGIQPIYQITQEFSKKTPVSLF